MQYLAKEHIDQCSSYAEYEQYAYERKKCREDGVRWYI